MIKARIDPENPRANLKSYPKTYGSFSWSDVEREFSWFESGKVNIVHEAIDRWASIPDFRINKALIIEKAGRVSEFSFSELRRLSCQWANLFSLSGLEKGDRLFIFLPPCPELYLAMLACARIGAVFCSLYPTLSYDELEDRFNDARPRAVLTSADLAERAPLDALSAVDLLFLTNGPAPKIAPREVVVCEKLAAMPEECEPEWLDRDYPLYLLYTSGSTGPPKGIVHAHGDMVGHLATARLALDLNKLDRIWTDGSPAWVTGAVYSAFAPWLCGAVSIVQADPFSASTWYRTVEQHKVDVWYTTPRTIRKLMEAGEDLPRRYDFCCLRHIATVGEALDPELFYWAKSNLKRSPHDTWWMTETGMICLANFPSMDIKPGSMGKPVPGVQAAVIDENGDPLPELTLGELALKPGWPSMMKQIWNDDARYRDYFRLKGWFATGDMVLRDDEGYYYHQGRIDDLIKAGDVLVGPYEIEQILRRHPAAHEAAVISREKGGQSLLKGFVVINQGYGASNRLNHELRAFVKANLSPDVRLDELEFLEALPKTRSGKLLRRVLRAREFGLPVGDPLKMKD